MNPEVPRSNEGGSEVALPMEERIGEHVGALIDELTEADYERTQKDLEGISPELKAIIGEEEQRYLTILQRKFDITFKHSLGVADVAVGQYDEFQEDLESIGISKETFLHAALLHDIGKLGLPNAVLQAPFNNQRIQEIFLSQREENPAFINEKLSENGTTIDDLTNGDIEKIDYRDFVSLAQCFEGDESSLEEIRQYGIDPNTTSFMDAIKMHEQLSEALVKQMDIPDRGTIAELVGSHHHYSREDNEKYSGMRDVLRMSVEASELLHLSDVYHAIVQMRNYDQHEDTAIDALMFIMERTKKGEFPLTVAKRWMKQMMPDKDDLPLEDAERYARLQAFIVMPE